MTSSQTAETEQQTTPAVSPDGASDVRPAAPARAPATPPPGEPQRPQRRRWPLLLVVLIVVVAGGAAWWFFVGPGASAGSQAAGPLTASGTLEADEVLVGSEISGRLIELAGEGQAVQAGDVVAKLDDSLIQLQISQAIDNVAARQLLEVQLKRYQLHSPISGVVTRSPMHVGEVTSPGQTVAAVADLANLKFTVYVLERDLGQVRVGQQVAVTADPFGNRTFNGVVTSINQQAEFTPRNVQTKQDRLNLVFGVQVRVQNPDEALKPGMPADATFIPEAD